MKLSDISGKGRKEKLKALSDILACEIDACEDSKSMAQLVKQYRETLRELEDLEKVEDNDDEIGSILSNRIADGKSGAIRKSST